MAAVYELKVPAGINFNALIDCTNLLVNATTFPLRSLEEIKWIEEVDLGKVKKDIQILHDDIFMGRSNSLKF